MHIDWEKKKVILSFEEMGAVSTMTRLAEDSSESESLIELGDFARNINAAFGIPNQSYEELVE